MNDAAAQLRTRRERAHRMGLFRYEVIQDALEPALSAKQRGKLVRELACRSWTDPDGKSVTITRGTVDRWIRAWRTGGFAALVPTPAKVPPRTPAEVLELAAALKKENPDRTATQVKRVLAVQLGWAPHERTLQRHFARLGLAQAGSGAPKEVFGRFEASRPNELWVGDALHGPVAAGRKSYLFAFLDDHSRAVVGHRFGLSEDTVRLAAALHPALSCRGVPEGVYVDNGSAFVDTWLLRACATLGIRLIHSRPGRPQGRGKIERFFRTVREQFLVETGPLLAPITDPAQALQLLNQHFDAWVATVYHRRVHSETGQAPITRFLAQGPPSPPHPDALREAFLWAEFRTVTKTATVNLHGNTYQVEPALAGRKVELVFDPFVLDGIEVRHAGRSFGAAIPSRISRHAHPKARPELPVEPTPATGINYLDLINTARDRQVGIGVNYTALSGPDNEGTLL